MHEEGVNLIQFEDGTAEGFTYLYVSEDGEMIICYSIIDSYYW